MSRPRHASGRIAPGPHGLLALVAGIPSVLIGAGLLLIALIEAFRYSPYGDPGAGNVALWLGIAGLLAAGIPLLAAGFGAGRAGLRAYLAWKRTLTPEERFLVDAAEVAALWGAHLAFREHNRREDARLTASVMGDARKYEVPGS